MIYKNDQGTNIIQLGDGDIAVTDGRTVIPKTKQAFPCCVFVDHNIHSMEFPSVNKPNAPHTILVFTSKESIDTVVKHLERARDNFDNKSLLIQG